MNWRQVALLGIGAVGMYVIGSAAIAHTRAIRAGELPTHEPPEHVPSAADETVAFLAMMAIAGAAFNEAPALFQQARSLMR